jgi:hypothetical protein
MMRFLSSEGWKEKSKPARVLMLESRAMTSEVLMRRFLRKELLRKERVDRGDPVAGAVDDDVRPITQASAR